MLRSWNRRVMKSMLHVGKIVIQKMMTNKRRRNYAKNIHYHCNR